MISKFSVKKPYTVLVGVIMVIVLGFVSFTKMTADLLPSMTLPYVMVMTTYVGASPETVETVLTKPIEASMATVSNIESINSISSENYSMVMLEFSQTTNMDSVTLEIREKLDQVSTFFKDDLIGSPMILKLNPDMMPVLVAAVGLEGKEITEVSTYVKDYVVPELESIEGVASVMATGLIEENVNVVIRQDKIDKINERIRALIDDEMEEAKQELIEGKEEVNKGFDELESGKEDLDKGEEELEQNLEDLKQGKDDLKIKQDSTLKELATQKTKLLTAKADLETLKITATTDLALLEQLTAQLVQLEPLSQQAPMIASNLQTSLNALKITYSQAQTAGPETLASTMEQTKAAFLATPGLPTELLTSLSSIDWVHSFTEVNAGQADTATVCGVILGYIDTLNKLPETVDSIKETIAVTSLCTTYDAQKTNQYMTTLRSQIVTYEQQLSKIDLALIELSKGESNAAIGFSNGNTELTFGEKELMDALESIDSAREKLKDTETTLKDALKEIENGQKQLEEARGEAYKQADLYEILTKDTISALLQAQNFSMPAGYIVEDGISYLVRIGEKPETVEEMEELPLLNLQMDGLDTITLGDVADVFYVDNSDEVYTNMNGNVGVMLTLQKQTGYSSGEVSDRILDQFEKMQEKNPELMLVPMMDQGIYIDLVMDSIVHNVLLGAFLAVLILLFFLRDIRPTLIVAISIPISLVTAIVFMYFSGVTLNVISLSGLALGIGMLVDNSIVVIENIYRYRSEGHSMSEAAREGAKEVTGAIVASTLTTICVFMPIVFTEGITRQLFVDMGLTIAYSLLASLMIAMTVVPAMASKVLQKTKERKINKFYEKFILKYEKVLKVSLKGKAFVFVLVVVLLVTSFLLAISNGTAFMEDMDSTEFMIQVELDETAELSETKEVTDEIIHRIMEIEDVENVGAMLTASSMEMLTGESGKAKNATTIYVTTIQEKARTNEEIGKIILDKTKDLGAKITVDTSSMDMSALGGSGIAIRVEGRDLERLQELSSEIVKMVSEIDGIESATNGMEEATEELRIVINKEKAMEYGLTVAQVFQQISKELETDRETTTLEELSKDYGVFIVMENENINNREELKDLYIKGAILDGEECDLYLSDIAEFTMKKSLSSIQRTGQTRYMTVSATLEEGYNIGKVSAEVEKVVKEYDMPDGYRVHFGGENEAIIEAMQQVFLMLILALVFMYLIMVAQFQSLLLPFIIMFTVPLAFTGGFLGLFFTGSEVSVIALIGFVMLSGIIVNNGIVLIDYINQLRNHGMSKKEAIIEAGKTRLRPVLMTALTTILGLLAMAFSKEMGAEMMQAMAIVVIGGLTYGTVLTVIVIPCIYDLFTRDRKKGQVKVDDK